MMDWTQFKERVLATLHIWACNHVMVATANIKPSKRWTKLYQITGVSAILHTKAESHTMFMDGVDFATNLYLNYKDNKKNKMKYIILETYPEPRIMHDPETNLPYYFDDITDALAAASKCERGQVVKIQK